MNQRLQEIDIPSLERLQAQCLWFHDGHVVGRGPEQMVAAELGLRAFAWQEGQPAPTIRPGSWKMQILLARGMAVQPLARILPDAEGYLPAGGNISDWDVGRGPAPRRRNHSGIGLLLRPLESTTDFGVAGVPGCADHCRGNSEPGGPAAVTPRSGLPSRCPGARETANRGDFRPAAGDSLFAAIQPRTHAR